MYICCIHLHGHVYTVIVKRDVRKKKERTQQARKNKETIAVLFVIKIFTKVRARMLAVFEELPQ